MLELFVVLLIIAILTAVAVTRIHDYKHHYYQATLLSDLRNLAVSEESYWSSVDTYTNDLTALNYTPTPQVTITFVEADSVGWSAKAAHANDTTTCAVYYGRAAILAPATAKTVIGCN